MKTVLAVILAFLLLSQVNLISIAHSLQQYGVVGTISHVLGDGINPGDRNGLNPR